MEALLTAASAVETGQPIFFTENHQLSSRMEPRKGEGLATVPDGTYTVAQGHTNYGPQFSAASTLILHRIKNGFKTLSSVAPMDTSSGVGDSTGVTTQPSPQMSSTLAMPSSRPLNFHHSLSDVSDVAKRFIHSNPPSLKRKRSSDAGDIDFNQSTIPFRAPIAPVSAPSPSAPPPPRNHFEAASPPKCLKCDQSTSTPENTFTTCHGCSSSWHQGCLTPTSTNGAGQVTNFLCQKCEGGNRIQTSSDGAGVQDREHLVERIRRKRISNLPPGVVPAKPELIGFLARQASSSERTEYFYNKKRTDLLNILSLCDQLKPQLLVDILVSVSKKHPDLPIYDDPDWRANLPSASGPKRATTTQRSRVTGRPRHGHTLVHPKASRKVKGSRKVLKRITVMKVEDAVPAGDDDAEEEEEEEDSLPPTWPKAGEGLYAKLPPEDEDRQFLEDDNDEEAFSHFMVDKFGKQLAVPACA